MTHLIDADVIAVQSISTELRREAARWPRIAGAFDRDSNDRAWGVRHVADELARNADDLERAAASYWHGYAMAGAR